MRLMKCSAEDSLTKSDKFSKTSQLTFKSVFSQLPCHQKSLKWLNNSWRIQSEFWSRINNWHWTVLSNSIFQCKKTVKSSELWSNFTKTWLSLNAWFSPTEKKESSSWLTNWLKTSLSFPRSPVIWKCLKELTSWKNSDQVHQEFWFQPICWEEVSISNKSTWSSTMISPTTLPSTFTESVVQVVSVEKVLPSTSLPQEMPISSLPWESIITLKSKSFHWTCQRSMNDLSWDLLNDLVDI